MSRTVSIPDDIHALIVDKQLEIRRKYKITVRISDIIALIVKNNIDKIGEYLGLKSEIGGSAPDLGGGSRGARQGTDEMEIKT